MNSKYNYYSFSTDLSVFNERLDLKKSADLIKQWHTIPKHKQKLYIKLYYKLLKSQIIKYPKNKLPINKWVCNNEKNYIDLDLLNHPSFSIFAQYNSFSSKHLKGYTRHGEKIYSLQSNISKNFYTDYNKLKKYYLQ